jgi:putative PIN family toxin of toxin-antitoxin system
VPRAVLDTGVLVAALISPRGAQPVLYLMWRGGLYEMVVSPRLLGELERVLARPKFRKYVSGEEASAFVETLRREAAASPDPPPQPGLTPDPGDDYLVALARAAGADYLVSGDSHLTGLADPRPPVLTPRAFLDLLTAAAD